LFFACVTYFLKKKTKTPHCRNSFKIQYQNRKKSLKIPKGGNQNPYIEDEPTIQWPIEKGQKDKQRSTTILAIMFKHFGLLASQKLLNDFVFQFVDIERTW
jgi:hypothetical protein